MKYSMLGKNIQAALSNVQNIAERENPHQPIFKGVLQFGRFKRENAYIFGQPQPKSPLRGKVIAILNKGQKNEELVVVPSGMVLYEPEIRKALCLPKREGTPKLVCLYEKSCGVVVFREDKDGTRKFLLVKNKNGSHWGFPKGHIEEGESEQQTAVREVREETGLTVEVLEGFRATCEYSPFGKIKKQVVFFCAQSSEERVVIQPSEIDRFQWATFRQAMAMFRYDNDIRVLRRANDWIGKRNKGNPVG